MDHLALEAPVHRPPMELSQHTRDQALGRYRAIHQGLKRKKTPSQQDQYFMHQVLDAVEHLFIAEIRERQSRVPGLKVSEFGHVAVWGGDLSPGCQHCVDHGFAPIRSASECNLTCSFCYYGDDRSTVRPLGQDQYEVEGRPVSTRELKLMLHRAVKGPAQIESIAWVFLEPFTAADKHPELIAFVKELGLYQHMYTNGTLCTEDNLRSLAEAGLDEIRFNLAATDCSKKVIRSMHTARGLFEWLCIESPMTPEYFARFVERRADILATGVSHIHCAEIHLNEANFKSYRREDLYQYSRGYISPMSSRRLTYDLMDLAVVEGWKDVVLHDCSNEVKFLRGVSGERFGLIGYEQELPGMPLWWFEQALTKYDLWGGQN